MKAASCNQHFRFTFKFGADDWSRPVACCLPLDFIEKRGGMASCNLLPPKVIHVVL